jgi:hypothetical protein
MINTPSRRYSPTLICEDPDMSTYRELGNQNQVQLRIRDWLVSIGFVLNCLACLFALVAGESQVSGCGTYRLLIRCIIVEHCRGRPVLLR